MISIPRISSLLFLGCAFASTGVAKISPEKMANTVILTEQGAKNLNIETVEAEEHEFEETALALGRIESIPSRRAVLSSRISGRITEIHACLGDLVKADAAVAKLESRQPGNPPPSVLLKTPQAGLVTECHARLGEPVEPDKPLLEITDLDEVHAIARVPEHVAGKIKPGSTAHIRVAALPDEKFKGRLLRFATVAHRESGTIDAIFQLPNPGLTLRPGLRAEFSIVLNRREGVLSIPRSALQGDPTDRYVYVADYELPNAFVKTSVQVGATNDRFVEITDGLFPGDKIVTQGAYSLAFAGKGNVSLKEALDAAHGHEHNEDGSEKKAGEKSDEAHEHGKAGGFSMLTTFSLAANALLFALLGVAMLQRGKSRD
jgi:cobalt-zinc-cadmium efflux system membrane fusion protein